jgi:hypothetical protein
MCGPADYDALRTCVTRLLGLSVITLAVFAIRRTARHFAELRSARSKWSPARRKPGPSVPLARLESRGYPAR